MSLVFVVLLVVVVVVWSLILANPSVTLYLIRHGETCDNLAESSYAWMVKEGQPWTDIEFVLVEKQDKTLSGQNEAGLTEKGVEQAKEAGKILQKLGIKPDFVGHTGLLRTRHTLKMVLEAMGLEYPENPLILLALRERFPGIYQNCQRNLVPKKALAPLTNPFARYDEGENLIDVLVRAVVCLRSLFKTKKGVIIIVCHEMVMKALLLASKFRYLGDNIDKWEKLIRQSGLNPLTDEAFKIPNACVLKVELKWWGKLVVTRL